MFLVRQFMDNAEEVTYPLSEAQRRIGEATYDQLNQCRSRINDEVHAGIFLGNVEKQHHIYELDKILLDEILKRCEAVEKCGQ